MSDKVALITGCSKRIGKEIALFLSNEGYKIIIHYNSNDGTENKLKKSLTTDSKKIKFDLNKVEKIKNFTKNCISKFGKIDLLINNASVFKKDNLKESEIKKTLNINLIAPYLLSLYIGNHMKKKGSGKIINLTDSVASTEPWRGFSSYSISKSGLEMVTKSLSKELGRKVQVNSIAPGPILKPSDKRIKVYKNSFKEANALKSIISALKIFLNSKKISGKSISVDNCESIISD